MHRGKLNTISVMIMAKEWRLAPNLPAGKFIHVKTTTFACVCLHFYLISMGRISKWSV